MFGLPLFLRKLYTWGWVFLALWIVNLIGPSLVGIGVSIGVAFICLGLQIWLGVKGNEMTAKNYLDNGWLFADERSDIVRLAKDKWRMAI